MEATSNSSHVGPPGAPSPGLLKPTAAGSMPAKAQSNNAAWKPTWRSNSVRQRKKRQQQQQQRIWKCTWKAAQEQRSHCTRAEVTLPNLELQQVGPQQPVAHGCRQRSRGAHQPALRQQEGPHGSSCGSVPAGHLLKPASGGQQQQQRKQLGCNQHIACPWLHRACTELHRPAIACTWQLGS